MLVHGKKKDENLASKEIENSVFIKTNTVHVFTCLPTFQASTLSLKPQQDHSVDLANEIENLVKLKMVRLHCCHGNRLHDDKWLLSLYIELFFKFI